MTFLEEEIVKLNVDITDSDEAIRKSGELLEEKGYVSNEYVQAMVESYHKNGPYFVIAPSIAITHARPEDGVNQSAVSLLTLKKPIEFGHDHNDPVSLIFGLAATSGDEHLKTIQNIVKLLENSENVEKLKKANTYKEIQQLKEVQDK